MDRRTGLIFLVVIALSLFFRFTHYDVVIGEGYKEVAEIALSWFIPPEVMATYSFSVSTLAFFIPAIFMVSLFFFIVTCVNKYKKRKVLTRSNEVN